MTPRSSRKALRARRGTSTVANSAARGSVIQAGSSPRVPSGWSMTK